jgi:hypothetical protein
MVASDLEKRLQRDLGAQAALITAARTETFRALGRHLRDGWLPRKSHKVLREAACALADELESEFGVDLRQDRQVYLGEEDREPEVDEVFHTGRRPRVESAQSGSTREDETEETSDPGPAGPRPGRPGRPGSKSAQRRETRDRTLAGDIRALYLILARALHPDKEPNPALREAKTVWMQKVTAAYERKNLGLLLDILVRNPLEALGPYLEEAPLKTVLGFSKRLRKDLVALKLQSAAAGEWLHPYFARFLKDGSPDEHRIQAHMGDLKRAVKLARQRRDVYRTRPGVEELIEGLKSMSWRDLL